VKKYNARGFQLELREKRTTLSLVVYEMYDKDIDWRSLGEGRVPTQDAGCRLQ
jgi:hypothetical protein